MNASPKSIATQLIGRLLDGENRHRRAAETEEPELPHHRKALRKALTADPMDFTELMRLAGGHVEARLVQTAVELTIFDALEHSAVTAEALANRLKLEPKATELLLNALASLELLDKRAEYFSLTAMAKQYLLKSSPQYVGGMIRFDSSLWSCWEKLPEAIRSGQPVRPPNMYQDDYAETEIFVNAMDSLVKARGDAEVLANAIDWSNMIELLDVGWGPATYPIALCERFPKLHAAIRLPHSRHH
jgi:hypothetical protein